MIGQELTVAVQPLNNRKESLDVLRVIQIRCNCTDLTVNLSQSRAPEAVLASSKIHEDQICLASILDQLWSQRPGNINNRCKTTDNQ